LVFLVREYVSQQAPHSVPTVPPLPPKHGSVDNRPPRRDGGFGVMPQALRGD
jgi:hypothetical protein